MWTTLGVGGIILPTAMINILSTHYVPATVLSMLLVIVHLNLATTL